MLTTQARPDEENPRSRWMDGNATFTMVPSRMTINCPAQSTASADQRDVCADELVLRTGTPSNGA
ncbi:hypothetical protein GCM10022227_13610 [Streptomyces sedi]